MTTLNLLCDNPILEDYTNPLRLDVVDQYLRLMRDKTTPDEAPSSLESLYPPWVAAGTYKTQELSSHCGPDPHMCKVYSR